MVEQLDVRRMKCQNQIKITHHAIFSSRSQSHGRIIRLPEIALITLSNGTSKNGSFDCKQYCFTISKNIVLLLPLKKKSFYFYI